MVESSTSSCITSLNLKAAYNYALIRNHTLNATMELLSKIFLIVLLMSTCHPTERQTKDQPIELVNEAVNTLRTVLNEQKEWVKVHAAEFLIWTGNVQGVKQAYEKEWQVLGDKPQYRIGIWRVLAQLTSGAEAEKYKTNILKAFIDTTGKDRIHAIETMAKLKLSPLPGYTEITKDALESEIKSLAAYTHWAVAYTNEDSLTSAKKYFLAKVLNVNEDIVSRRIAAYVLRNSGSLEKEDWNLLSTMVLSLPGEVEGKISFLNAALLTSPEELKLSETYKKLLNQFLSFSNKKDKASRMDIAAGLAAIGTKEHIALLEAWMKNTDPIGVAADDADVQASAAYAIVKIMARLS